MNTFLDPRFAISYTIILLFAGAYIYNPDATMKRGADRRLRGRMGLLDWQQQRRGEETPTTPARRSTLRTRPSPTPSSPT